MVPADVSRVKSALRMHAFPVSFCAFTTRRGLSAIVISSRYRIPDGHSSLTTAALFFCRTGMSNNSPTCKTATRPTRSRDLSEFLSGDRLSRRYAYSDHSREGCTRKRKLAHAIKRSAIVNRFNRGLRIIYLAVTELRRNAKAVRLQSFNTAGIQAEPNCGAFQLLSLFSDIPFGTGSLFSDTKIRK